MDIKAFKTAVEELNKEKGISQEIIYDAMSLALTSAYKKNYNSLSNVRVDLNMPTKENENTTGEIKVYSFKTVVQNNYEKLEDKEEKTYLDQLEAREEAEQEMNKKIEAGEEIPEDYELPEVIKPFIFDGRIHLTLKQAKEIVPSIKIGETIETEVTPKDFGRVAASTAKQVIIQKMREAERNIIIEEFSSKEGEMLSGIVAREDERNYYIHLGKAQGILPKTEIIPGETIKMNANIKVYVSKVENTTKGPLILLSRSHYGFIKRLFELEIPEINDGIILIYSVAREAGLRTKVAVFSENSRVDAIGSCIGENGARINRILKELNQEKVDIIKYDRDLSKFIENALSPAKNLTVLASNENETSATVIVDDDNLALAIGKGGTNVKLASRLTRCRIDIKSEEDAKKMGINIIN